jgi:hypothetical protein
MRIGKDRPGLFSLSSKMLPLEGYISNFTCARYYLLYVEFSDFYVNQSLPGQTLPILFLNILKYHQNVRRVNLKKNWIF